MEQIILNLVPGGVSPVCYVSQYDVGRKIRLHLRNGSDPYVLSGAETINATIRKVSGEELIYDIANTSTSYVDLIVNYDATDVIGESVCELIITESGLRIGSANFKMRVDPDVYSGDQKLEVVTASSPDSLLSFETNIDENLLELKAGFSPVQDLHGYDSPWPAGGGKNKINPDTVELSNLTVSDGIYSATDYEPYENICPINGYSSANITRCGVNLLPNCTAESHTANSVTVTCNSDGTFTSTGTATGGSFLHDYTMTQNLNIISGMYLHCGNDFNSATLVLGFRYTDGTGADFTLSSNNRIIDLSSYVGKKVNKIRIYGANGTVMNGTIMPMVLTVNAPTAYTPYNGQTYAIAFGQTVYGGVLDVTRGKLTVTWSIIDLGDETLNYSYNSNYHRFDCSNDLGAKPAPNNITPANALCSCYKNGCVNDVGTDDKFFYIAPASGNGKLRIVDSDYSDVTTFKAAVLGQKVAYELATPFDIDLTPVQISVLVGENNVLSDTNGGMEIKYFRLVPRQ